MASMILASVALICMIVGLALGLLLRRLVPDAELHDSHRDSVKTGAGLIATLAALVLGLLVTSAKSSFDSMNVELTQASTKIILLDRALAQYGEQARPVRNSLLRGVQQVARLIWPDDFTQPSQSSPPGDSSEAQVTDEQIEAGVRALVPADDAQTALRANALGLIADLSNLRWMLFEQSHTELPTAFIVLLIFWLTVLFGTFGLLAPRSGIVLVVLLACAVSVASVIFLIREMNHPLRGVVQVSSVAARQTLNQLGK